MKYEVYHGTNQEIDSFKHGVDNKGLTSQYGFWFTDSIEEAHQYGKNSAQRMHKNQEAHDVTVEKYLADIKNAERRRDWDLAETLTEKLEEFDGADDKSYYIYTVNVMVDNPLSVDGYNIGGKQEEIIKVAIDKGHDSVIFNDISDSPYGMDDTTRQIVVFDNSNIKIVNVDEFDGEAITETVNIVNSINEALHAFIKSLERDNNKTLIEAILAGYNVLIESNTLYRGLESKSNPKHDLNNITMVKSEALTEAFDYGNTTSAEKMALTIRKMYTAMRDEHKEIMDSKVIPRGHDISYTSLSMLPFVELLTIKENARILRDREKKAEYEQKQFKRNQKDVDSYYDQREVESIHSKWEGALERKRMIEQGEYDETEVQNMIDAGIIDKDGNPLDIENPLNESASQLASDKTRQISEILNAVSRMDKHTKSSFMKSYVPNSITLDQRSLEQLPMSYVDRMRDAIDDVAEFMELYDLWKKYVQLQLDITAGNYTDEQLSEMQDKNIIDEDHNVIDDSNSTEPKSPFDISNPYKDLPKDSEYKGRSKNKGGKSKRGSSDASIIERPFNRMGEGGSEIGGGIGEMLKGVRELKNAVTRKK